MSSNKEIEVEAEVIDNPHDQPEEGVIRFADETEALIVAQAMYKSLAEAVSTKDPDSLRGRCDARMRAAYESEGTKTRALKLGRYRVGTYSVTESKEVDRDEVYVTDQAALDEWAAENGYSVAVFTVTVNPAIRDPRLFEDVVKSMAGEDDPSLTLVREDRTDMDAVRRHLSDTGEPPDGMAVRHVHIDPCFKNTRIVVEPDKVFGALAKRKLGAVEGVVRAIESAGSGV